MSDLDKAPFDYINGVRGLINTGLDVNSCSNDDEGRALLMLAANSNLPDLVKHLISEGANVDVCDGSKLTVLHHAARKGWLSIARSVVEKGIDVNATTESGKTPLILAAEYNHLDIVKFLVSAGANVNACVVRECFHSICIDINLLASMDYLFAMEPELFEIVSDRFPEICQGRTALLAAVSCGHTEIAKFLIGAGANVNCYNFVHYTPLHHASSYGFLEIAQALVESQADLNAKTDNGFTPLYMACDSFCEDIVECLVDAGVDLNAEVHGESPLTYLIRIFSDVDLIKLFIKRGANLTSKEYKLMLEKNFLKEIILQDVKLCSEIIIDKFNNKDLPEFYELANHAFSLPKCDKLKITAGSKVTEDVMKTVEHNIQANGHCNILEVRPIVLSMISVRSFIGYYHGVQESKNALTATQDSDNEPGCCKDAA